MMYMLIVTEYE